MIGENVCNHFLKQKITEKLCETVMLNFSNVKLILLSAQKSELDRRNFPYSFFFFVTYECWSCEIHFRALRRLINNTSLSLSSPSPPPSIQQRTATRDNPTLRHSVYPGTLEVIRNKRLASWLPRGILLTTTIAISAIATTTITLPRCCLLRLVVRCRRHLWRFQRPTSRTPPVANHLQPVSRISSPLLIVFPLFNSK